jgi:hypothetical protein
MSAYEFFLGHVGVCSTMSPSSALRPGLKVLRESKKKKSSTLRHGYQHIWYLATLLTLVLHSGEHVGRCINIYAMAWAQAIINIALDLWMLALPASQVLRLNMQLRKKMGVMVMFGLGIL